MVDEALLNSVSFMPVTVDVNCVGLIKLPIVSPANAAFSVAVEIYPFDPRVFTVEIRFDLFAVENPLTVEISCGTEIYICPRPAMVDAVAIIPGARIFDVVEVSAEIDIYPNVPRPLIVEDRVSDEIYLEPRPANVDVILEEVTVIYREGAGARVRVREE